jgi:hypothetical protein
VQRSAWARELERGERERERERETMMMAEGFETPTGANSGLEFGLSANEGAIFATPGGVCGGLKGGAGRGKRNGVFFAFFT